MLSAAIEPRDSVSAINRSVNADAPVSSRAAKCVCVGVAGALATMQVAAMCPFQCAGFFDGVPPETIERYPHIQGVRAKVMGLPEIKAHYAARPELSAFEKFITDTSKC